MVDKFHSCIEMTISALDKDTVKLITTTQVITSVSTAVKELIENALDADAKNIEINLTDNGHTLIEVKDDGCGISKVDAPYVALSSHTSKIFSFSDLDSLGTYGFRGEALHALSAVSDLTIVSKTEEDEAATSYTIDRYGHIIKSEPCHRLKGTTVLIKQLFKHVPVRRQIITNSKKANQEIKILESLVKSYGMCKFSVRISYKVDSNIIFAKPSTATLEEAVTYILGKKVTCNMNWINITDTDIKMKIMVPLREMQNMFEVFQSGAQYIFVNNRPIKYKELEKVLTKTILEALGQELSSRKKPIFVLYILMNAADIDVNLEPNKSSVLFKDQNMVINIIEKYLKDFYGIQEEVQEKNFDNSFTGYQDYTQKINVSNVENEEPIRKKRKLHPEENVDKLIEKDVNTNENTVNNEQNCRNENNKESKKNVEDLNVQLPLPNLSDSDSNDSQNCVLAYNDKNILRNPVNNDMKENTENSPPLELMLHSESFSQLPIVDLGEDIEWHDDKDVNTNGKENIIKNANVESSHTENKLNVKKTVMLKEWSKGHVSDLKGGTDVEPYNYAESNESSNNDVRSNVCEGFLKFSKRIRAEVTDQNPTMTAPQVAYKITNLWKNLSPEERGYYRDLARDEKLKCNEDKLGTKEKRTMDVNKNKNRLLKALEKMKIMDVEKKENLVMRTTVPWDIDLKKVTEKFLDNYSCKNTNLVVGLLGSDLWIVYKSAHIWILDAKNLKTELHISDINTNEDDAESIERLLKQWFSLKDDLSLLHPIHSFTQIKNNF